VLRTIHARLLTLPPPNTLSRCRQVIHYMHDRYNYERLQMALHDTHVRRLLAFGISGLSVVTDSLSAIKYAKVYPVRDERGIAVDFKVRPGQTGVAVMLLGLSKERVRPSAGCLPSSAGCLHTSSYLLGIQQHASSLAPHPPGPHPHHCPNPTQIEGAFPKYGNDDDRVDAIATWLTQQFSNRLSQQTTYRNSVPTLSVLTITSNVVYGKKTGGYGGDVGGRPSTGASFRRMGSQG
jgi:hypothetical protein